MSVRSLIFLILVACLAGCGSGGETRTDRHGTITFRLPLGWTAAPASMETRFRPPEGTAAFVEIQVSTILIDEPRDLEKERDHWLAFHKEQGHAVLESGSYTLEGLSGVEYAHEMQGMQGAAIQHHVAVQQPGVLVATHLQVSQEQYETWLPVFREVLDSIRPVGSP